MFKRYELEQYFPADSDCPVPSYILFTEITFPMPVKLFSHVISEFMFIEEGNGYARVEDKDYPVYKDDFYIVNPTVAHTEYMKPGTKVGIKYFIIGIKNVSFGPKDVADVSKPIRLKDTGRIKPLIHWLYEELSRETVNDKAVTSIFYLLMDAVKRTYNTEAVPINHVTNDDSINAIVKWLDNNYLSQPTIELVSKKFFCSPSTLAHNFKKHTGMPFKHYVRKKTLEEAKNWMRISNLNITQICIKFGFCSPAYFTLCFKKAFGMTPREYMQQVKAERISLPPTKNKRTDCGKLS